MNADAQGACESSSESEESEEWPPRSQQHSQAVEAPEEQPAAEAEPPPIEEAEAPHEEPADEPADGDGDTEINHVMEIVQCDWETARRALENAVKGDEHVNAAVNLVLGQAADVEQFGDEARTSDERSEALAAGAALGSIILKRFGTEWCAAEVLRYNSEYGHLLQYEDDGAQERVVLSAAEWRPLEPNNNAGAKRKRPAEVKAEENGAPSSSATAAASSSSGAGSSSSGSGSWLQHLSTPQLDSAELRRKLPPNDKPPFIPITGTPLSISACEQIGWSHIKGLDVTRVQQWVQENWAAGASTYMPWGDATATFGGQKKAVEKQQRDRAVFLNRSQFPDVLRDFFTYNETWANKPAERDHGPPNDWLSVPECMLDLDQQLRHALPSLLGPSADDGDFVLAYAQTTRMPPGNTIASHFDDPSYGDVIITVGLCGTADVKLTPHTGQKLLNEPIASRLPSWITSAHQVGEGHAYLLGGPARWKLNHMIWSHLSDATDPGYGPSVSRVAVTLRYFRRTFCLLQSLQPRRSAGGGGSSAAADPGRVKRRENRAAVNAGKGRVEAEDTAKVKAAEAVASKRAMEEAKALMRAAVYEVGYIVDVRTEVNTGQYPFTYPCLVLERAEKEEGSGGCSSSEQKSMQILVQYLCDGNTACDELQALEEDLEWIDVEKALPSPWRTVRKCVEAHGERLLKVLHPAMRALLGEEEEGSNGVAPPPQVAPPQPPPAPPSQPHEPEVIDVCSDSD